MAPEELTLAAALALLDRAAQGEKPLGYCPETGKPVYVKTGRFGPYVQRGEAGGEEKPQSVSLLRGMHPEQIDLPTALALLSLPRSLGTHPQNGQVVTARTGRFGPYVQCGEDRRSLPSSASPLTVTLQEALDLLAQPKQARRGGRSREPIRVFSTSPVTNQPVQLLAGRYGPYVTDGTTNASLPRGVSPEQVTFEQALELLAARAAQGPSGRSFRKKTAKAAPKAAARKTPKKKAKKRTTKKKKTAKKRTTKKPSPAAQKEPTAEAGDQPATE
jgi:DNA topoisomerase I